MYLKKIITKYIILLTIFAVIICIIASVCNVFSLLQCNDHMNYLFNINNLETFNRRKADTQIAIILEVLEEIKNDPNLLLTIKAIVNEAKNDYLLDSAFITSSQEISFIQTQECYSFKQSLRSFVLWIFISVLGYGYMVFFHHTTADEIYFLLEPFFNNYFILDSIYQSLIDKNIIKD